MKTQIKKSLSLFLAVMMLLSCWVWVAPEKAEAALDDGHYEVTIGYSHQANFPTGSYIRMRVYYLPDNGVNHASTGKAAKADDFTKLVDASSDTVGTDVKWKLDIPGFPVFFECDVNRGDGGTDSTGGNLVWNYLAIGNSGDLLAVQSDVLKYTYEGKGGWYGESSFYVDNWYGTEKTEATTDGDHTQIHYGYPVITQIINPQYTAGSVKLNKMGGADVKATGSWSIGSDTTCYDQYNAKWVAGDYSSLSKFNNDSKVSYCAFNSGAQADSSDLVYNEKMTVSATSGDINTSTKSAQITLTASPELQAVKPNGDGKTTVWVSNKYIYTYTYPGSSKTVEFPVYVSVPFNITYPQYSTTFNGDGITPTTNGKAIITTSAGTAEGTTTITDYYEQNPDTYPKNEATKTGYDFLGFFTGTQPTSGDASPYVAAEEAATPIDSNVFAEYEAAANDTDGDDFVTYNNVLYCDAGKAWDPTNRTVYGDGAPYNGWWRAKQLEVKFYDVDGAYLGTLNPYYGQTHADVQWPDPKDTWNAGAFTYDGFNGTWSTPAGKVISETNHSFTEDLVLTPNYGTKNYEDTYDVKFINPAVTTGANLAIGKTTFNYRDNLTSVGGTNYVQTADDKLTYPGDCNNQFDYTYEFVGWTTAVPANNAYHIMVEEGGFDPDGKAIVLNEDWIVRDDVSYYAVFRRTTREYVINFSYKNNYGEDVIKEVIVGYNEKLEAPYESVPFTYAKEGNGYTFVQWNYRDASSAAAAFEYNGFIYLNQDNMNIAATAWNDGEDVTPYVITAGYSDPVPTPYDITFKYLTEKGEEDEYAVRVNHGSQLGIDAVNYLLNNVAYVADDGETVREYKGYWTLEGTTYNITELDAFAPTAHTTFTAVYEETNAYYDVTYIDGDRTQSYHTLGGDNLPIWTIEVPSEDGGYVYEEYIPEDYKVTGGTYVFQGWFDEEQTDKTFANTNGTKYTYDTAITADVTLYSQFKYVPDTFEFVFLSHDGETQLGAFEREYGQELDGLASIIKGAQARPADDVYSYEFIGWDKEVPSFCEGYDMTFIAQYKATYNYYDIQWFNTEDDLDNVADDEGNIEGLLETTHTTFGGKVYAPPVTLTPPTAESGFVYVTTGWYYKDAEGNEVKYVRGMEMTSTEGYKMYAKYEKVAQAITVVANVKGVITEYQIAYGTTAADIVPTPVSGYVDEAHHDTFVGWYTDAARTAPFDIDTTVLTGNISIYAKFTEEIHQLIDDNREYINKEVTEYPTYYTVGKMNVWCECDKAKTTQVVYIPQLTDTVAPTGTIYLGTWGSWSSTDEVGAAATDGDEVSIYVNDTTDIIITINDTGDKHTIYNPTGEGIGIAQIQGFISTEVFTGENSDAIAASKVLYEYDGQLPNNAVNVVIDTGEYNLQDGEEYIAYYYAKDKSGNVLNTKVRTAKFIYDITAPEFTVEGANNSDKVKGTPTYCQSATVTGIEANAVLKVNGTVIDNSAITWAADGTGSYAITDGGNYLVTVTDRAGNETGKKFVLSEDHSFIEKTVAATCTTDGYIAKTCAICDYVADKETVPALGHEYIQETVAATCEENGYILHTCSRCGDEKTIINKIAYILQSDFDANIHQYCYRDEAKTIHATKIIDGVEYYCVFLLEDGEIVPAVPALGHNYPTDTEGNIVYTVTEKATCKNAGSERAICARCFKEITREIPVDTANGHKFGAIKTVQATCTQDGYRYRLCKLCNTSITVEELAAKGHRYDAANDDHYVVTTQATCAAEGVMTLKCQDCNADILDENGVVITKAIAATGEHNLVAAEENEIYLVAENDNDKYLYIDEDNDGNIDTEEVDGTTYYKAYKTYAATGEHGGCITYNCSTCDGEWYKTVDKIVSYTVTFRYTTADGEEKEVAITKLTGETVSQADLEAAVGEGYTDPYKETVGGVRYIYEGIWMPNAAGEANVELPLTLTKNITLTPVFTAKEIIYTHMFMVPTEYTAEDGFTATQEVATLVGTYGDTRVPATTPVFQDTAEYTFEFNGWKQADVITKDFSVTEDKTFVADFTVTPVKYSVIFYNTSATDYICQVTVNAGETAVYTGAKPIKAPDENYHYTFKEWNKSLENIMEDTRVQAVYTAVGHTYDEGVVKQDANCTLPEYKEFTCTACGYKKTEQTAEPLGHNYEDKTTAEDTAAGITRMVCSRCGDTITTSNAYDIKFKNEDGLTLQLLTVGAGNTFTYGGNEPTKASTAEFNFVWNGWKDTRDNTYAKDYTFTATEGMTYTATFEAVKRTYTVLYIQDGRILQSHYDLEYGAAIPAYNGAEPTKAASESSHFTFSHWGADINVASGKVTGNITFLPEFNSEAHTWEKEETIAPTCTEQGGYVKTCSCGYEYLSSTKIPALGHEPGTLLAEKQPTTSAEGYKKYICSRCDKEFTVTLPKLPSEVITVTVYDANGQLVTDGSAVVTITNLADANEYYTKNSNNVGVAQFTVASGTKWRVGITGPSLPEGGYGYNAEAGDVITGGTPQAPEEDDHSCSCSCHRDSFWGIVFRFFHKIIKMLTGSIRCCSDPDPRYFK